MDINRLWVQDQAGALVKSKFQICFDSKKINLVFDFDGVITQPQGLKSAILSNKGYSILPEQTDKKKAQELMLQQNPEKGKEGVHEDYMDMINQLYVHRMIEVPPEKDAVDVLKRLEDSGKYSSYIVTSRRSSADKPEIQAAGKWLQHYGLRFDGVINTSNQNKRDDLKLIAPIIFVDDSYGKLCEVFEDPERCSILAPSLFNTYFALFRQKANRHVNPIGLVNVIENGWLDLESKIYELSR